MAKKNDSDDITFDMVDEATVARMQKDGKVNVPEKKISIPKDERWNEQQLGSKLLQGILNGDSIDSIATSLTDVIGNNMASAVRNARTMVTSAECHGRLDSYEALAEKGVLQKKVWIATPDDRVRESHLEMDGEEAEIDEEFSNGCEFPGDSGGPPEEVWNCRCSIRTHIVGFRHADGSISYVEYDRDETMHDKQIEAEKERRKEKGNEGKEKEETAVEKRGQIEIPEKFADISSLSRREKEDWEDFRAGSLMEETGYEYDEAVHALSNLDDYFENYYPKWKNHRETEEDIEGINKVLSDMKPYDGTVYRGMHFKKSDPEKVEDYEKFVNADIGSTLKVGTITSWTSNEDVAKNYGGFYSEGSQFGVILQCENKTGVGVQHLSRFGVGESEVMQKSTTEWEILKKEQKGDVLYVYVKEK